MPPELADVSLFLFELFVSLLLLPEVKCLPFVFCFCDDGEDGEEDGVVVEEEDVDSLFSTANDSKPFPTPATPKANTLIPLPATVEAVSMKVRIRVAV
jgi:hypothetical protein